MNEFASDLQRLHCPKAGYYIFGRFLKKIFKKERINRKNKRKNKQFSRVNGLPVPCFTVCMSRNLRLMFSNVTPILPVRAYNLSKQVDCEQCLFCSKICGEGRKTSERASVASSHVQGHPLLWRSSLSKFLPMDS